MCLKIIDDPMNSKRVDMSTENHYDHDIEQGR